jgi:hypothetical protein
MCHCSTSPLGRKLIRSPITALQVACQQQFAVSPHFRSPDMPEEQQALAKDLLKIVDELDRCERC